MENMQKFNSLTFCALFHELTAQYGNKDAVRGEDKTYSYVELDEYSNSLAKKLIGMNVQPEEIIAINLGRSADILVAILGIWKSGAAYLFLDTCYPKARNDKLFAETGCRIVIDRDFMTEAALQRDAEYIDRSVREHLAMLIYTSGSTSAPKGVMIEHRNMMSSISNAWRLSMDDNTVTCVFPSYSFVASVYDTFGTLSHAGTIDIIPEEDRRHIDLIEDYFVKHKINIAYLPPHMARKMVKNDNPDLCLKELLVGGEVVRKLEPDVLPIINVYAATETCSLAVCYKTKEAMEVYPIGTPNPNLKAYIVDENGNPVKDGEKGELWLAGPQITRGYYKRPEETAQHYAPNPFCSDPGYDRVFKTRDLTHWLDDGNIMYDGRIDNMLKIRGFRVEAGAVEAVMLECADIKEAVVTAFTDNGGTDILCGYFTSDKDIDVKKFKEKLRHAMPYYMVPTALIRLDEMPINVNKKIDRKALKPPKELNDHKLLEKLY